MATLIITTLIGIIFAFLATQNTTGVDVRLASFTLINVPLYLVALGSLLIGLFVSSLVQIVDSLATLFTIHSKDSQIKTTEKDVVELKNTIHDLELENARLKGEKDATAPTEMQTQKSEEVIEREPLPNFFKKLQHNFIP